jgi:hypothetical protein
MLTYHKVIQKMKLAQGTHINDMCAAYLSQGQGILSVHKILFFYFTNGQLKTGKQVLNRMPNLPVSVFPAKGVNHL